MIKRINYTESGIMIVVTKHSFEVAIQAMLRGVVAAVAEIEAADEGGDLAVVAVVLCINDHTFLMVSVNSPNNLLLENAELIAPVTRGKNARDGRVLEELTRLLVMRLHHSRLHHTNLLAVLLKRRRKRRK